MDNLIFSANIVLPLLVLMIAGYITKQIKLIDSHTVQVSNNLVFRVFLPILLCKNIMNTDTNMLSSPSVFAYVAICVSLLYGLLFLIIPKLEKENSKRGVMIQAIGRSNYALFGIPLVSMLFPNQDVSIASLLVAVTVPLFNGLSIIALEVYAGEKTNFLKVIKNILTNPLIIGSAIGFVILLFKIPLPPFINKSINDLAQIASPLALFLLGGSFEFSKVQGNKHQLFIGVLGKLVVSPLIFVSLAIILGYRGVNLAGILITFAAPTAVNSFTMAHQMGGDSELAAEQIVFSSIFSIFTVFIFVFVLKQFNWL